MIMVNVTELNENNFNGFVSSGVSLVDIWAPWCGPCKMISPIIDELSDEYRDLGVKFGKLNADDSTEKVRELGVRNIPTLLIYKDGNVVERLVGMTPKAQIKELLDKHI